jgi:hypothetical protein
MVNQKMIKKSETTLASVVVSLLIVMAIFYGGYLYISANAMDASLTIPANYTDTYDRLQSEEALLKSNVNEIKSAASNVSEADVGFATAWNGLKGLIAVVKVPFNLVSIGQAVTNLMITPLTGYVPSWAIVLIDIGIIMLIVFIIWSILKGDPNVIR